MSRNPLMSINFLKTRPGGCAVANNSDNYSLPIRELAVVQSTDPPTTLSIARLVKTSQLCVPQGQIFEDIAPSTVIQCRSSQLRS